ncbi:NTF2 fold immunity protein [Herbaspirillum sp. SJZ107]|uniref:NTF2 fold immunity protein n=1 Tax=Herbaspirillum sp. SJZ107 TaxID=2572881 RepID=UPI0011512F43|nr:NTF2 fold immunity protein [Herbaspirillum sp. SJZ107]TQK02551.1 NTF2 fold immunity protein of polymorphic toxin system component [Herbaspirillum sp. SJZ107]
MRATSILLLLVLVTTELTLSHAAELVSKQALKETESRSGYQPANGFVPDPATAIAIAVAVWEPVYGKKNIAEEAPYQARLEKGHWIVTGTLPKGRVGGTATVVIDKMNGRIITLYHTK